MIVNAVAAQAELVLVRDGEAVAAMVVAPDAPPSVQLGFFH